MKIKELNELLESPEVKEIVESAIQEQCKERQDLLDAKIKELEESKKATEKEFFIKKQMLLSKANLYEGKLKEVYESKFKELSKKVSADVFSFINESINGLTKAVVEETSPNKAEKMQEAFSNAVRVMSPFLNINELVESNTETIEKYKQKLNAAELENHRLRSKVLSDEFEALVVKECAGYPLDKKTIIVNTLKELKPKTLTEAKNAIEDIKKTIREKVDTSVTESKKPVASTPSVKQVKSSLITLAENIKAHENKKKTSTAAAGTIEPLDIF